MASPRNQRAEGVPEGEEGLGQPEEVVQDEGVVREAENEALSLAEAQVTCDMTQHIFLQPVFWHGTGRTVEEEFAKEWKRRCEANGNPITSPWSHNPIPGTYEVDNRMIANVDAFLQAHPEKRANQYKPQVNAVQHQVQQVDDEPLGPQIEGLLRDEMKGEPIEIEEGERLIEEEMNVDEMRQQQQNLLDQAQRNLREREAGQQYAAGVPPVGRFFAEQKEENIRMPVAVAIIPQPDIQKCSCLLMGSSSSGKSAFVTNLTDQEPMSLGIDFKMIDIAGIKFRIFDMAGQERFRTINKNAISRAAIVLFFEDPQFPAKDWLKQMPKEATLYSLKYNVNTRTLSMSNIGNDLNRIDQVQNIPNNLAQQFSKDILQQAHAILSMNQNLRGVPGQHR